MDAMRAVYNNSKHLEMDSVKFVEDVKDVEFTMDEKDPHWRRICIDGDILTLSDGASIRVEVCDRIGSGNGFSISILC
jgi:hypothetical protein